MRRLIVAFGFLTRLPMPRVTVGPSGFAEAIRFYPIVGLAVGVLVAVAGWLGALIDPWTGAFAALLTWVAITGALHLDGLADLADGLGAAHGDRTRLLAVMADPHIGSFGVVAIVSQMIAKLVLLHAVGMAGWWVVILVPCAARMGPLAWARMLPPIRAGGLGAAIAGAVRRQDLIGWGLVLALAAVMAPALVSVPFLLLGVAAWLRRTLGGVTGDAYGAGIEIVETGVLLALAIGGGMTGTLR
ncbi:adenosylcobinamide-GDP ribazoletransferase [Sphingomonas sp. CFBP 13728]|uniref:adenosylcobinamide-GDP ribazoletransferase n=1 Tax=Sphingomonas sp. CFBP 13728 TaxID=2775294 RepID=UPI0017821153|nr:adenosylcobinamide-GDP ribazoletransferase [Sphingomonas sp. CFBP 13728]MBD8617387.1 adenosylcobinamide-GDP ribazoletransferase [Sphingomonas sp. CFBP 13728]